MRKLRVCLFKDVCVPILITVWIDIRMNAANPKVENVLPGGHREPFLELRPDIDSSTIDGNVEFVHAQYSCILTSQVSTQFLCPRKLLKMVIIL